MIKSGCEKCLHRKSNSSTRTLLTLQALPLSRTLRKRYQLEKNVMYWHNMQLMHLFHNIRYHCTDKVEI